MLENSLSDFGKRMNMPSFALNREGLATLQVGELCFLSFEKTETELLMYITFKAESYDHMAAERVLELTHYKHNFPFKLYAGVYNNKFVLLTRFFHNEVTAALMENAFQFLINLMPKAEGK